ncbi:phosphate transporter [Thozetella sp. PMI_491]|nr:phosphate transporter [Thozetella sp. PMI_491]
MPLHQFDYLFAIGTIFAFLDAWNIGANDVANSWATSISSRSVTYLQAMVLAAIMEFSGSIGVGARVADTIRTKIVKTAAFADNAPLLMLLMLCAVVSSSIWLTIATKFGMPVSTTHSIMGGVIGAGIAALGANGIQWVGTSSGTDVINSGVVSVFVAWIVAPGISACFGAIIFMSSKYLVMLRKNPVRWAFAVVPWYFGIAAALLTMLLLTKGGTIKSTLTEAGTAGVIVGVGFAFVLLVAVFLLPWLWRIIMLDDWQLKWYHIPLGPLLLRRGEVPPRPEGSQFFDFYAGHLTKEELAAKRATTGDVEQRGGPVESTEEPKAVGDRTSSDDGADAAEQPRAGTSPKDAPYPRLGLIGPKPKGAWYTAEGLFWWFKWVIFRGVDLDIIEMQQRNSGHHKALTGDLEEMHAHATHYDNKAEYMFSFLQVMTAATASFTHGANDVANAIGPYATIFQVWQSGAIPKVNGKDQAEVPLWILAFGGIAICIGLWTYGYHIVMNLGNRLTLHSPSRGFSMELGAAVTIILATKLALPVSTTQCITGATVGVGFCNGDWRSINWRMVAFIYFGWILTLPMAGIISGCLMGIIINAPRWGMTY